MKKKKVLIHSNFHKLFTGFGKNAKNILSYLYKTGKYEVVELANGKAPNDPSLNLMPWKSLGMLPSPNQNISAEEQQQPQFQRKAGYGFYRVDEVIKEEKPDIYLGIEDIWAFSDYQNKPWWNKINCMIWTTLDSLPILPQAVEIAPHAKHYYAWSTFAEKPMEALGHDHFKTLFGSIDTSKFFRLSDYDRQSIRSKSNIDKDDFIIGFVFRNQLRKSVPNLLDGFKLFINKNPKCNAKLLLHTHWSEGWDIPRLLKEKGIDPSLVLTTYFCKSCKQYEVKSFQGQGLNCRLCGAEKSQSTTNITDGVSDKQLNEVYNLLDVYCHPFTSGGMEIPVFEAKLTELITLVTDYSCGQDSCTEESGGLPLSWAEYREPGTQFIKASTKPESICRQLSKVYKMKPEQKRNTEKVARDFVVKNYSIEAVGSRLEEILDNMPEVDWDYDMSHKERNPNYSPPNITSNKDWLKDIYKNILMMDVEDPDQGLNNWMQNIEKGQPREDILRIFREVAVKENKEAHKIQFEDLLDKDDKGKRILYVMPKSIGDVFWSTSLMPSLAKVYPEYNIYFATEPKYFEILDNNPYIHKVIPYNQQMDNLLLMEGQGEHEGFFEITFLPYIGTQRIFNYQHNGKDIIQLDIRNEEVFADISRGAFG